MAQQNMNQPDNKRKISPDNIPPTGEDPSKEKNRKFNIYWIYGHCISIHYCLQSFSGV